MRLIPQIISPDRVPPPIVRGKHPPVVFERLETRLIGVVAEDIEVLGPNRHAFPVVRTGGVNVEPGLVGQVEKLIELGQPFGIELARLGEEPNEMNTRTTLAPCFFKRAKSRRVAWASNCFHNWGAQPVPGR